MTSSAREAPNSVSTIELFFDLVFVFVIARITDLVEHAHGAPSRSSPSSGGQKPEVVEHRCLRRGFLPMEK